MSLHHPTPPTVQSLLSEAREALGRASFKPSRREATLLLAKVLHLSEAQVRARTDQSVSQEQAAHFHQLLARRLRGEPVAYLFENKEFYGRDFYVDSRVLVPRPETEHLIEAALACHLPSNPRILDIGTGSGCIAITLALEYPTASVVATDLSLDALQVAHRNRARHRVHDRVDLVSADLLGGLRPNFDLVVSNPPYISPADGPTLSPEVREFEPPLALFADAEGLHLVEALIHSLERFRPGTPMLMEIGHDQSELIRQRLKNHSRVVLEKVVEDYAGIPRTILLRRR